MKRNLLLGAAAGAAAGAVAAGAFVHWRTRRELARRRPLGRFVVVDGVRLHYVETGHERGEAPPLVLLHGLGSMVEDFVLSGLVGAAARGRRVIAFDRPGYGWSDRPGRWRWDAEAQARLFARAFDELGVRRPVVLGHSWGALVAVALGLDHPGAVQGLVLASGIYFPSARLDQPFIAPAALPVLGDAMRHTVSPLLGRALWPAWLKMLFAPHPVPVAVRRGLPAWMTLRPSTMLAVAEEAAFLTPATLRFAERYAELAVPTVLLAGAADRYVSTRAHTVRLHGLLSASELMVSPEAGHMVHHADVALALRAIERAAAPAPTRPGALAYGV